MRSREPRVSDQERRQRAGRRDAGLQHQGGKGQQQPAEQDDRPGMKKNRKPKPDHDREQQRADDEPAEQRRRPPERGARA